MCGVEQLRLALYDILTVAYTSIIPYLAPVMIEGSLYLDLHSPQVGLSRATLCELNSMSDSNLRALLLLLSGVNVF